MPPQESVGNRKYIYNTYVLRTYLHTMQAMQALQAMQVAMQALQAMQSAMQAMQALPAMQALQAMQAMQAMQATQTKECVILAMSNHEVVRFQQHKGFILGVVFRFLDQSYGHGIEESAIA